MDTNYRDIIIYFIWIGQIVIMASFDNREGLGNKVLNWSALITSAVITYFWGGVWWLVIPILAIPIVAGILGGTVKGLYEKHKNNKEKN